jgi:hypothetical protein
MRPCADAGRAQALAFQQPVEQTTLVEFENSGGATCQFGQ